MRDVMAHMQLPACGVFHAGGVLRDAALAQQSISGLTSAFLCQGFLLTGLYVAALAGYGSNVDRNDTLRVSNSMLLML